MPFSAPGSISGGVSTEALTISNLLTSRLWQHRQLEQQVLSRSYGSEAHATMRFNRRITRLLRLCAGYYDHSCRYNLAHQMAIAPVFPMKFTLSST